MVWDGHPGSAFHRLQGPLKHLAWGSYLSTQSYCYCHVHITRSVLRRWTKHHQGSQEPLQSYSRATGTSLNVFPCQLVWVYAWSGFCIGTNEDPSLRFFATIHVKDQLLGNVFAGTFSDSFRQELSLHPQCQDVLQSTSCQIWDFLASCWDCFLSLWLEICVPNDKFDFSGDNCKSYNSHEIFLAQFWKIVS